MARRGGAAAAGRRAAAAEVRVRSLLEAPAEMVWDRVTSFEGVNDELFPLLRMTAPGDLRSLRSVRLEPGRRLGRSWLLLLGLIPFEYDDIALAAFDPGRRFLERSSMLSQRLWEHERTVSPDGAGRSTVEDRVRFEPRLRVPPAALRPVVGLVFRHRHRRLRRRFGGAALPVAS